MVIKNKYDIYIGLTSYVICFPLSILFYLIVFHLSPTDIPDYIQFSILNIFIGLAVPIYPSIKLSPVIKRKVVSIYEKIKKGTFRFDELNKAFIVLCSTAICSPLSVLFYVLFFHLVPEDFSMYEEVSNLAVVIGLAIPIYPIVKLYDVLKKNIIVILEEVKEGTFRLEFHNPPLSEQYPEIYSDERNKIMSYEKDESDNTVSNDLEIEGVEVETQIVKYEKRVSNIMTLFEGAVEPQSMWQNYKNNKQINKATDNLQVIKTMFDSFTEASNSAGKASEAKQELERIEILRKRLPEKINKEQDLEIAKLDADKAEQLARIAKSNHEISRLLNTPQPSTSISREESQIEKQKKLEADEDKKDLQVNKWRKELSEDPHFRNEDIEIEIERKKRTRGWLDRI